MAPGGRLTWINTTRINDIEYNAPPLSFRHQTIAGGPGNVIHYRQAFLCQAIEKSAFTHIRSSNQGNNWL
jgi:hypothetical protein